jgi:hypothetical protein
MKKSVGILACGVLLAQGVVHASELSAQEQARLTSNRPARLVCTADQSRVVPGKTEITIEKLNTVTPALVKMDAPTDQVNLTVNTLEIIAHNGCDNYYDLVFFNADLEKFSKGELTEVRGFLNYFNGDTAEGTTALTCK